MVSNASDDFPDPDRPVMTDQLVARQIDVDILEVVNAGAPHRDPVVGHTYCCEFCGNLKRTLWLG